MKDPVRKEKKRQKKQQQRIQKLTNLAHQIQKDDLFFYHFVKKSKMNEQDAVNFLKSISIKVTPQMANARKKKLKEIKLNRHRHKEKVKKQKEAASFDLPDIPWLDDDCSDARYQMELIWMSMNPDSNPGCDFEISDLCDEDDLPF